MLVYLGCHLDMSVLPYIEVSKCLYAIFKKSRCTYQLSAIAFIDHCSSVLRYNYLWQCW